MRVVDCGIGVSCGCAPQSRKRNWDVCFRLLCTQGHCAKLPPTVIMPKYDKQSGGKPKHRVEVTPTASDDEGAPDELTALGWTSVPDSIAASSSSGRSKSASDRLQWASHALAPGIDGVLESADDGGLLSLEVLDGSAFDVVRHDNGALEIRPRAAAAGGEAEDASAVSHPSAKREKPSTKQKKQEKQKKRAAVNKTERRNDSPAAAAADEDDADAAARDSVPPHMLPLTEAPGAPASARWAHNPYMMASELPTAWSDIGIELHPLVAAGVISLGFPGPTPVQRAVLLEAVTHHRDVVAAAETGSGKTLAFTLPLLQRIVERRERLGMQVESVAVALSACGGAEAGGKRPYPERFETLAGLVVVPTRELALQVHQHFRALARHTCVTAVAIVGGMAEAKQERLLNAHPDLVVATPGRLWDWVRRGHSHLSQLHKLQVLVMDEADSLAGQASNEDLGGILQLCTGAGPVGREASEETTDPILLEMRKQREAAAAMAAATAAAEEAEEEEHGEEQETTGVQAAAGSSKGPRLVPLKAVWTNRQTLLFSATLGFSQGSMTVKSSSGKGGKVSVKGRSRSDEAGQRAYFQSLVRAAGGAATLSKKQLRRLEQQAKRMRGVDALLLSAGVSSKPLVLRVARASEPSVAALLAAEPADGVKSLKSADGALEWGTAGERLVETAKAQPWMEGVAGETGGETMVILRGRAAVESGGIAAPPDASSAASTLTSKLAAASASSSSSVLSSSAAAAAREPGEWAAAPPASASASAAAQRLANAGASIALPRGLCLQRVLCAEKERDTRLYWVLSLVQGRAIVFVNSIHAVRSVSALLAALGLPTQAVHAKMQQRQRLKQLDRFKEHERGVLVATDVAARGLDVEGVAAVVHYHVPRQADIFVHRSGRTARAGQAGVAITLVTPGESEAFERILVAVRDATGCPLLPLDRRYERRLAERVTLARQIVKLDAQAAMVTGKRGWMERAASDAGLETEDADVSMGGGAASESAELAGKATQEARKLRGRLQELLATPLLPEGVSRRYLTAFAGMPGVASRGKAAAMPGSAGSVKGALLADEPSRDDVVRPRKRQREGAQISGRGGAAGAAGREPGAAGVKGSANEADEDGRDGENAFVSDDEESLQWSEDEDGAGGAGSKPVLPLSPARDAAVAAKRRKPAQRQPRSGGLVAMPVSDVPAWNQ